MRGKICNFIAFITYNILQMIEKYVEATEASWRKTKLLDVWEIDRSGEVMLCVYVYVCLCVFV